MSAGFFAFDEFDLFSALFAEAKTNTALLISTEGLILKANHAFTAAFGYTEEEICGKYFSFLFIPEDRERGRPETELEVALADGRCSDNNYLLTKDGRQVWVSGESIKITDGAGRFALLKIIQNIDVQKISEVELRRLNDLNEKVLQSIEDVVILVDSNFNFIKTNAVFNRLFVGNDPGPLKNGLINLMNPYDTDGLMVNNLQNPSTGEKGFIIGEAELRTANLEKRIFTIVCKPITIGSGYNLLLVFHDMTTYKLIEREREDVLGFVAHELRNPIANLLLANEIIREAVKRNQANQVGEMLDRSKNHINRLHRMIAELYDATKAKSGQLQLDVSEFDFGDMVNEAIETVSILQPSYHISFAKTDDVQVTADRDRLIQVITNYLSNAIKYSPRNKEVRITIQLSESHVTVAVTDSGLGIPAQQLPLIFDKFYRSDKTKNIEGVGLGLYLSRQIIHAHNGQVWVESEEGKGSTFYFSVPRRNSF